MVSPRCCNWWTRSETRCSSSCSTSGAGSLHRHEVGGGLQHAVAHRHLRLHARHEVEALANVVAQLGERLELAHLARPIRRSAVGKRLLLRFLHDDAERRFFAGELAETLGQLVGELEDRAGRGAVQLTVERRHDVAAADLVEEVADDEAFDLFAVDRAANVDRRVVAVGEREVGVGELGRTLAQRVDLTVDVFVAHVLPRERDGELVVADEAHDGAHFDDGVELDVAVVLAPR